MDEQKPGAHGKQATREILDAVAELRRQKRPAEAPTPTPAPVFTSSASLENIREELREILALCRR